MSSSNVLDEFDREIGDPVNDFGPDNEGEFEEFDATAWERLDEEIARRRRDLVVSDDLPAQRDDGPDTLDINEEAFMFSTIAECAWAVRAHRSR